MSDLRNIQLKQPLNEVKLAKQDNDIFICPTSHAATITNFLQAYEIPYTRIEDPELYPKEKTDQWLSKYCEPLYYDDPDEIRELVGVSALITKFDAEALFDWAIALISKEQRDPAYQEYLDKRDQEAEEYYQQNE